MKNFLTLNVTIVNVTTGATTRIDPVNQCVLRVTFRMNTVLIVELIPQLITSLLESKKIKFDKGHNFSIEQLLEVCPELVPHGKNAESFVSELHSALVHKPSLNLTVHPRKTLLRLRTPLEKVVFLLQTLFQGKKNGTLFQFSQIVEQFPALKVVGQDEKTIREAIERYPLCDFEIASGQMFRKNDLPRRIVEKFNYLYATKKVPHHLEDAEGFAPILAVIKLQDFGPILSHIPNDSGKVETVAHFVSDFCERAFVHPNGTCVRKVCVEFEMQAWVLLDFS